MDPVVVVGAGIAGITCARTVAAAGLPVVVLDRGRRIGGRMATRRHEGRPVDTGASYLTVSDDRFAAVVEDWRARGLAHPWTDSFTVLSTGEEPRTTTGPVRWGTPQGARSLVEDLATGLTLEERAVERVEVTGDGPTVDGVAASAVVLAMPDPQAARLLPSGSEEAAALTATFDPVLALSAGWHERRWDADLQGAFVNGDDDLAWVADDGRRRGDGAPVLVAHSTTGTAAAHLDHPQDAEPQLLAALRRALGVDADPAWTHLHRWSFAKPAAGREATHLLTDRGVGACGDGWSAKPRVEGAYLSGLALGEALVARLG